MNFIRFSVNFLFVFLFFVSFKILASEPVKIAVITDLHYFSSQLADDEKARQNFENATGRNIAVLHEVLDTVMARIKAEKPDYLLVSGDITHHGERQSHLDFAEKLKCLQQNGIKTLVVPGNHDINIPNAKKYTGNDILPTQLVSAAEFIEIYRDFGYGSALKRDTASLSYLTELNSDTWLLCFDTNRYAEHQTSSISGGRILPQTMAWALNMLREAKEKNITVLGMMHHGLVEHMPYQSTFFAAYLIDDWQKNAEILADAGLKVVFTGHFHANDATSFTSPSGNTITDVETGSLSQYPFPYRLMTLEGKRLAIDTHLIKSISGIPDLQEKYRLKMEIFARKAIGAQLAHMSIPISDDAREALVELLTQIDILHVGGDEQLDDSTRKAVRQFAEILGDDDFDIESFQLDFPPADNRLVIELNKR